MPLHRKPSRRRGPVALAAIVLAVASTLATASAASASAPRGVCTGGAIEPGTYRSLTVTGVCWFVDQTTVTVEGNLTVAPGAQLNPVGFSNGQIDLSNFNMAVVHVHGNVLVGAGAIMGLGCSVAMANDPFMPFPKCSKTENSDVVVDGNLIATAPRTMYLDGITVHGNVISSGGGPGLGVTEQDPAFNFPVKDITVGRNLVISGWHGGWVGAIRDQVGGNIVYVGNAGTDPDANEVITNTVGRNLVCAGNSPAAQYGDAAFVPGAAPNSVGRHALGQCADLTQPLPPPPAS
jgi:hypothetical protein